MKRIIGFLAMTAVLYNFSCSDKKPVEVKKEVIIVPAAPTIIVKDPPEKATSITLDKNGVKVQTKKVNVVVNPPKKKN